MAGKIYTYHGPEGTNPAVGRLQVGREFNEDQLPPELVKDWESKKWLVLKNVRPLSKEVE